MILLSVVDCETLILREDEENRMKGLINKFLTGNCPECSRGDSLVAYLAAKLNCPVNRINAKLVNSITLLQVTIFGRNLLLNVNIG